MSSTDPILWNKLGSTSEVQNSEIGQPLLTGNNPVYTSGYFGFGYETTSSKIGYCQFPHDYDADEQFTLEYWYKPYHTYFNNAIHIEFGSHDDYGFRIWEGGWPGSTNGMGVAIGCDAGTLSSSKDSSTTFTANTWYFIQLIIDPHAGFDGSKTCSLRVDGVEVAYLTDDITGWNKISSSSYPWLRISYGNRWTNNHMDGIIDNIKIYNLVKTSISDRFDETPTSQAPVLWNKLGSYHEVNNSEIGQNGFVNGSGEFTPGYFGNGSQGYTGSTISSTDYNNLTHIIPSNLFYLTRFTIEFWYKKLIPTFGTDWNDTTAVLIGDSTYSTNSPTLWLSTIVGVFMAEDDTLTTEYARYVNTNPNDIIDQNEWVHIALVSDFSNYPDECMSIYINGTKYPTETMWSRDDNISDVMNGTFRIGGGIDTGTDYGCSQGIIDNLKIYDYPKCDFSDRFNEAPVKYRPLRLHNRLGNSNEITESVVGQNLEITGTGLTYTTGRFGTCVEIPPGGTSYCTLNSNFIPEKEGCIELWVKHLAYSSTSGPSNSIIGVPSLYGGSGWYNIYLMYTPVPQFWGGVGVGPNSDQHARFDYNASHGLDDGEWHHVAMSWSVSGSLPNGHNIAGYIDGNLMIGNIDTFPGIIRNTPISIGNSNSSDSNWSDANYLLDNLKIYDYPKSNFDDRFKERSGLNDILPS